MRAPERRIKIVCTGSFQQRVPSLGVATQIFSAVDTRQSLVVRGWVHDAAVRQAVQSIAGGRGSPARWPMRRAHAFAHSQPAHKSALCAQVPTGSRVAPRTTHTFAQHQPAWRDRRRLTGCQVTRRHRADNTDPERHAAAGAAARGRTRHQLASWLVKHRRADKSDKGNCEASQ